MMVIVAAARGDVGTDTWVYNNYYDDIRVNGCSAGELEPFFCAYSWLLSQIFASNQFVNSINAILIALCLYIPTRKSFTRSSLVLLLIFPIMYFDFAMNGVRAGLAYTIFFAVVCYAKISITPVSSKALYIGGVISSAGMHVSALLLAGLHRLTTRTIRLSTVIGTGVIASALAYVVVQFLQPLLLVRAAASLESEPFSAFSGYAPTIINLVLVKVAYDLKAANRTTALTLVLLNIASLGIARFTYNGIRILQLLYFLECLILVAMIKFRPTKIHYIILTAIVVLTLVLKVRNWENEKEIGATPTPFIPYHTFFSQ